MESRKYLWQFNPIQSFFFISFFLLVNEILSQPLCFHPFLHKWIRRVFKDTGWLYKESDKTDEFAVLNCLWYRLHFALLFVTTLNVHIGFLVPKMFECLAVLLTIESRKGRKWGPNSHSDHNEKQWGDAVLLPMRHVSLYTLTHICQHYIRIHIIFHNMRSGLSGSGIKCDTVKYYNILCCNIWSIF